MIVKPVTWIINFVLLLIINVNCDTNAEYCSISDKKESEACGKDKFLTNDRYILYDVNPPEGFNLRRDVYVRIAVFVKHLAEMDKEFQWHLVLPPWGPLYHWQSNDITLQMQLPWGTFFDIPSLQKFAPVIEMYQFLQEYPSHKGLSTIDKTYILQNDEEMFMTGKFNDKNEVIKCPTNQMTYQKVNNGYKGSFWGYSNITSKSVNCIIYHGTVSGIKQNLAPHKYRSIKFDHMEIPLHDYYGSIDYWTARRSMRYNSELYEIAKEFRKKYLNSNDEDDKTERSADWIEEMSNKPKINALGGPYISVHLRRKDFLYGHANSVPSIKNAASQLQNKLDKLKLQILFVASDTNNEEYLELKNYLSNYTVIRYKPTQYVKQKFKDGGISIIDQILCSYSRYFIGTAESTFTFRIQEDREIVGFSADTTFNFL